MSRTKVNAAVAVASFDNRFGSVVATALRLYAEQMRETAAEAEAGAREPGQPPAPPQANAQGNITISIRPTPNGFAAMAVMFRESADKADKAATAYQDLLDAIDPDAG
jgi:hypothetical protein